MGEYREMVCEARLENLPALREFVQAACRDAGGDDSVCFALKLAVDEACINIILHGYASAPDGLLELKFQAEPQRFVVTIRDHAPAFAPELAPPPDLRSDVNERKLGGLGWYLISQFMDEVHYQSDPGGGNLMTLIKRVPPAGS